MKNRNEILDLKIHELKFAIKKLEIHQKINQEAMTLFSEMFKEYVNSIDDGNKKHKLKQAAGLAGENERRSSKTAKKAKQQKQYKRGDTKVQEQQEQQVYEPPPEKPKKELPKEYKSLYRKIASKTHPDKIKDDEEKKKILQEVTKAITNEDYFKLIESALKLDIDIPEEIQINFGAIQQKIASIHNQVKQITKSVAWEWYHLEDDEQKKKLIEGYATFIIENK